MPNEDYQKTRRIENQIQVLLFVLLYREQLDLQLRKVMDRGLTVIWRCFVTLNKQNFDKFLEATDYSVSYKIHLILKVTINNSSLQITSFHEQVDYYLDDEIPTTLKYTI